eukprot:6182220-Pleurochrysis_carterae.AAC.1
MGLKPVLASCALRVAHPLQLCARTYTQACARPLAIIIGPVTPSHTLDTARAEPYRIVAERA